MRSDKLSVEALPREAYMVETDGHRLVTQAKRLRDGGIDLDTHAFNHETMIDELRRIDMELIKTQMGKLWKSGEAFKEDLMGYIGFSQSRLKEGGPKYHEYGKQNDAAYDLMTQINGVYRVTTQNTVDGAAKIVVPKRERTPKPKAESEVATQTGLTLPQNHPSQTGERKVVIDDNWILQLDPLTADSLGIAPYAESIKKVEDRELRDLLGRVNETRIRAGKTLADLSHLYGPADRRFR